MYISRAKLALATRGAPDVPTNVYPRNLDFEGRKRPLFLRFTRSLSVPSMNVRVNGLLTHFRFGPSRFGLYYDLG